MITLDNEMVVMFDVDDTLVMWSDKFHTPETGKIEFVDPYDDTTLYLKPHRKHINFLKQLKARGYTIIVWSGGGYRWAKAVVETLGLKDSVDVVMTKPAKFVDDLPANEVLVNRVYLEDFND
jgi:FMN phosphatase YigB (HAD superfamily)